MKYLATVNSGIDTYSQTFDTLAAAEQWLDQNNNNFELATIIETYDDNWRKIDSFYYTEPAK